MVSLENLLLYVPLAGLLVMLPGPDFALITRISLAEGRGSGQAAACGVALGIMVHTSAAMLGISEGAVKQRLVHGRQKFRQAYEGREQGKVVARHGKK